jgi:hypothetical protein
MVLANMLLDSAQLTQAEIEAMLRPLNYFCPMDERIYNAVAKTACAEILRLAWMDSPEEITGRAGWDLLVACLIPKGCTCFYAPEWIVAVRKSQS